jgi:hypothetical protein
MTLVKALIANGSAEDENAAIDIVSEMQEAAQNLLGEGSLTQVEALLEEYGLEPDYLEEILPC